MRLVQPANRELAGRQFVPCVTVPLGGHEAFEHRPSNFQQTSHQARLDHVDALAVVRRLFHELFHLPQLLLRLEKRALLRHHHRWASW